MSDEGKLILRIKKPHKIEIYEYDDKNYFVEANRQHYYKYTKISEHYLIYRTRYWNLHGFNDFLEIMESDKTREEAKGRCLEILLKEEGIEK